MTEYRNWFVVGSRFARSTPHASPTKQPGVQARNFDRRRGTCELRDRPEWHCFKRWIGQLVLTAEARRSQRKRRDYWSCRESENRPGRGQNAEVAPDALAFGTGDNGTASRKPSGLHHLPNWISKVPNSHESLRYLRGLCGSAVRKPSRRSS
jgi:hypothetical protein